MKLIAYRKVAQVVGHEPFVHPVQAQIERVVMPWWRRDRVSTGDLFAIRLRLPDRHKLPRHEFETSFPRDLNLDVLRLVREFDRPFDSRCQEFTFQRWISLSALNRCYLAQCSSYHSNNRALLIGCASRGTVSSACSGRLLHQQVSVLRMLLEITRHQWAYHIDLHPMVPRVLQCIHRQLRCQSRAAEFLRNLRVDEPQYFSRDRVFKIGDMPILLDLESPRGHLLLRSILPP